MSSITTTEIYADLHAYFSQQLPGWSDSVADTDPLDRYGLDSTEMANLILYLEETFLIEVSDSDLTFENLGTIKGLVTFVNRKSA